MPDAPRYRLIPTRGARGLYGWEMRPREGNHAHNPCIVATASVPLAGHNIQKGDIIHIEHEALPKDTKVLHSPDWPAERKARFRLWHNGEAVDQQVIRHASYDPEGKIKIHTVGQTVTVKPDSREGGATQTQGIVEDARVLNS